MTKGKRKNNTSLNYEWSKYQKDIFDYIEHGQGHLVVEAAAGSGKTSTLVKSLELIPETKKILLTAFNTDIVKELEKKTKDLKNVDTKTLHGLGLAFLKKNFPEKKLVLTPFKYDSYLQENISDLASINTYKLGGKYFKYLDNIKKYINYGRFYLCETVKDLDFIQDRYDIETIADEKEIALEALRWGKEELDHIDYGDMIWMPHVLYLKPLGLLYDFIMVDECQDMNKAERELILKCFKMGTRLVSVGDSQQMLYSFAGGDPQSFNALKSIPNTVCLPLSISYRCASKIVDFAKRIVPSIEPNNDGRVGEILHDVPLDVVCDGDMVLCRNNAPLVQAYNTFLKLGKKAFIRGKDIGANLKTLVRSTRQDKLNADLKDDGVFVRLYDDLFVSRNKLMDKFGIDEETAIKSQQIQSKLDSIKALEILSEGLTTAEEVMTKIDEIFPAKDKKNGIALSTVHKAKGLEANNVYIVCNSLMPNKSAKKDWEIKQEYNLMYVAYTRAKNTLGFIDEKEFEQFDFSNSNNIKILKRIESQVNQILNKSTKIVLNETNVKTIIRNAQKIDKDILTSATVSMNSMGKRKVNAFSDLLKNKKTKKVKL